METPRNTAAAVTWVMPFHSSMGVLSGLAGGDRCPIFFGRRLGIAATVMDGDLMARLTSSVPIPMLITIPIVASPSPTSTSSLAS